MYSQTNYSCGKCATGFSVVRQHASQEVITVIVTFVEGQPTCANCLAKLTAVVRDRQAGSAG